ncbi:MAG: phage major capsid domain-containing protein, partial [Candidatus Fonsibacter sp.]
SNHVYNVAAPTLETIISREVLWKSTVTLKITTEHRPEGTYAMNYGVTDALAPFPLHSLVHVMSATMSNNTVSF